MNTYSGHTPFSSARTEGFSNLWRNIVRHKLLFAVIVSGCCIAGGVYILLATPQYRADALLRVQIKPGASVSALSDVSGTMSADQSADDETDVLSSRTIVGEAISETGADTIVQTKSYFPLIGRYVARRAAASDHLRPPLFGLSAYAWGGERLKAGVFEVPAAAFGEAFRVVTGERGAWTLYDKDGHRLAQGDVGVNTTFDVRTDDGVAAGQLRIDVLRARPGVEFTLTKVSPQVAYENVTSQLKSSVSAQTSSVRDSSMMRLSYQAASPLAAQEMINAIVRAFVKRNVDDRAAQARMKLKTLSDGLPQLKRELLTAEDRLNDFRMKNNAIDMEQQGAAQISRMNALAEKQAALRLEMEEKGQFFAAESPVYKGLALQLEQVRRDMAVTDERAKKLPMTQREFVRLSSDVAINKQIYTGVLANIQQLQVAAESTASGVNVMDWAVRPDKPTWPRNAFVLLGSLLGGLFAATAAVHLLSLKHKELRTPQEIDYISDLPRLAVVARSRSQLRSVVGSRRNADKASQLLALSNPDDPSIEALRALRSSVRSMLSVRDGDPVNKIILFTGPTQGVGKSFVSSNFAYLLSQTNASVLLIDADMRRGTVAPRFSDRHQPGLAEVLKGTATLAEAIVTQKDSRLSVLGAGYAYPSNPAELLSAPAFREMLDELRQIYDFVVMDSPPVLPFSDAVTIAAQGCDLVLLVSRADHTGSRQLEETLQRLSNVGATVGGHIFNGFNPPRYGEADEYGLNAARY